MSIHNSICMHNFSQPGQREAYLTCLGLQYLPETDQEKFFDFLNKEDTKNPAFRRLLKRATSNKFHQYHPKPIKRKERSKSL